jgi:hypothetical protein
VFPCLDTGGSYDVVMCRHVLAHNGGHEAAIIAHLIELARPRGAVYLVDIDGTAMRTHPEDPDIADLNAQYAESSALAATTSPLARRSGPCSKTRGCRSSLSAAGGRCTSFHRSCAHRPGPLGMR